MNERTDPSVGRIIQIAKILGEDPVYFFQEKQSLSKVEEAQHPIGYATKNDIEELAAVISKLQKELANLKANLQTPAPVKKPKKRGSQS